MTQFLASGGLFLSILLAVYVVLYGIVWTAAYLYEAATKNRAGETLTAVMQGAERVLEAMGPVEIEVHICQRKQALIIVAESIVADDVCAPDWFETLQRRVWLEAYHWRPGLVDPRPRPAAPSMPGPGRAVLR